MFSFLHEVETVTLRSSGPRPISEAAAALRDAGFTLYDDVYCLDRADKILPWQHDVIADVEIRGVGVDAIESGAVDWDEIKFDYLFPHLPFYLTDRFIEGVFTVGRQLKLTPIHSGILITSDSLRRRFAQFRSELIANLGDEPGSEPVAIYVASTYPR